MKKRSKGCPMIHMKGICKSQKSAPPRTKIDGLGAKKYERLITELSNDMLHEKYR